MKITNLILRHFLMSLALLIFCTLFFPHSARSQDFLVNTNKQDFQVFPSIAALTGGGFVIAWTDGSGAEGDGSLSDIRAQRYDSFGTALGEEFLVNTTIDRAQFNPIVAGLTNGEFIIVWQDQGRVPVSNGILVSPLQAQRFSASGIQIGPEFIVENPPFSNLPGSPTVTGLADGGFLVSWDNPSPGGPDMDTAVLARRYTQSGTAVGDKFLVNTTTNNLQNFPSIAALTGGGVVIVWQDLSQTGEDTSMSAIRAQRFDSNLQTVGNEFLVNTTTELPQSNPVAVGLAGGGFAIAWTDSSKAEAANPINRDVRAQIYTADGAAIGEELIINTTNIGFQIDPAIAAFADGGFIVTWTDDSHTGEDTSGSAVRAQRLNASGAFLGSEFLVNTTTFDRQSHPTIAALDNGAVAITWQDDSGHSGSNINLPPDGDFSKSGIRAALFDLPGPTILFSSVLPAARSGFLGGPAITVFASVINAGSNTAKNCMISLDNPTAVSLSYQKTNAANMPVGLINQSFEMRPGTINSFVSTFSPITTVSKDFLPDFVCDGSSVAAISGVNTVFLSIDTIAVPDILSISATPDSNGIISIPQNGTSFMSVSATNIGVGDAAGSQDATISVSVDDGGKNLPLFFQICETNAQGACISPLGPNPITTTIKPAPSFFAVFAFDQASGGLPLDPANARVFLRFTDQNNIVRSVTSAALTVQ